MTYDIAGRVVRADTGFGIADATVELFGDEGENRGRLCGVRTDRHGAFYLRRPEDDGGLVLRVSDGRGTLLASEGVGGEVGYVEVPVEPDDLSGVHLRSVSAGPLLRPGVFDLLSSAIGRLPAKVRPPAAAALEGIRTRPPPICSEPGLLDLARGVLDGRGSDVQEFRDVLARFATWGAQRDPGFPRVLSPDDAHELLSAWRKVKAPSGGSHGSAALRREATVILAAAAVVSGTGDPVQLIRNVEILHHQLASVAVLDSLVREARRVLAGRPGSGERFLDALSIFEGAVGWPRVPELPGWLPELDDIPWELPPVGQLCDAVTATALVRALESASTYRIDDISPPRACPGETITIQGSGFQGPGYGAVTVLFPGPTPGVRVPATPTSVSDDTIEVVVPDGATSGRLALDIEVDLVIEACGIAVDLSPVAAGNVPFTGGTTSIESFRIDADHCLHGGDPVVFMWRISNADTARLTIDFTGPCATPPAVDVTFTPEVDSYTRTVPTLQCHTWMTATLEVDGACGTRTATLEIGVQAPSDAAPVFAPYPFVAWHYNQTGEHDNIVRNVLGVVPEDLDQLVAAVAGMGEGDEIGVMGSGWSYTECVVPPGTDHLIATDELRRVLDDPPAEHLPLREDLRSVLPSRVLDALGAGPVRDRLVHVEAGIKLHRLNCELECRGLALPSLGGDKGQSIAGAINTGTHGANPYMPPISDQVRAIHLVGPGGLQWWIEPEGERAITDAEGMEALKRPSADASPRFDPCLRVVYDDELFRACLVAFGSAGVAYSLVLEAVPAHTLESTTEIVPWDEGKEIARSQVIDVEEPVPWFLELTVNPTRNCWMTTREPTDEDPELVQEEVDLRRAMLSELFGEEVADDLIQGQTNAAVVGLGAGALAVLMNSIPFYILRRTLTYALYLLNPFTWWRLSEVKEEIELVGRLAHAVESYAEAIVDLGDEHAVAATLPPLLNVLWQIGFYVVDGRTIVEEIQNLYTTLEIRPVGRTVRKSYTAMTGQVDCGIDPGERCTDEREYPVPAPHAAIQRLVHSYTFVLPADECLDFVDDVLAAADVIRLSNDAVIVVASVRFTGRSRAYLGMQQMEPSGHVELYTIDGFAGNPVMHAHINALAMGHRAIPHWGQVHRGDVDLSGYYPELDRWRAAMDRIATEGGAAANVFRHSFARDRGVLEDL